MSLKTVTILVMAGLMANACARTLKSAEEDKGAQYGFSYTSDKNADHKKLSMHATEGILTWYPTFTRNSSWSFISGNGCNTITQRTKLVHTGISYEGVRAQVGDVIAENAVMFANLRNITWEVSLTAEGDQDDCTLKAKIAAPELNEGIDLYMDNLIKVDYAFRKPEELKALKATIWQTLSKVLPDKFTKLVNRDLHHKINIERVCELLVVAKYWNYPMPNL